MVNENTRMYIPEENHQGKRDPSASPGSPALPTAGPGGAARAACARGANVARGSPRGAGRAAVRAGAENSRPSPSAAGASSEEHVVPMKSRARGKVPQVSALPGFLAFASKAGRPVWPRRAGERLLRGPLLGLGRGRERARSRAPHGEQPRTRGPPGCPASTLPRRHFLGQCAPGRGWGWGRGLPLRVSARLLSPSSRLLGFSTPPTSPLPLTPSEPTPGVFLFAPQGGLAPEDGKRVRSPSDGFAFPGFQGIMKGCD